jgi:hypothetical protein
LTRAGRLAAGLVLLLIGAAANAHPSRGIVATADGRIYFSDLERLWTIGRDGRLTKLREQRDRHTHELALDGAGNVIGEDSSYVGGAYRESVWAITPDGRFRILYGPTTHVVRGVGVIRDARGCTYHSNQTAKSHQALVHRRCPDGRIVRLVGSAADDAAFRQELVSNVSGAFLDPAGGFVFRQGTVLRRIAPNGSVRVLATGIAEENFGIARAADGSILVVEAAARRIVRLHQGARRTIAATSARPWFPTGVAEARGSLFVLEATDYVRGVPVRMRVRRTGRDGRTQTLATITIPPA